MTLVILAAGSGSRYGGLKQFDGVGPNGEYLMDYNIYDSIEAGFRKLVIITKSALVEEISVYLQAHLPTSIEFCCVAQSQDDLPTGIQVKSVRQKPWGTAHAVWCARDQIQGKFVTINADDLYGRNAFRAAFTFGETDTFGAVAYSLKKTLSVHGSVSRGVCNHDEGRLQKIVEYKKITSIGATYFDEELKQSFTGNELVSMNMWILDPTVFPLIEDRFNKFLLEESNIGDGELLLPDIIQETIDQGKEVQLQPSGSEWVGLTYPEDREHVTNKILEYVKDGHYPSALWT